MTANLEAELVADVRAELGEGPAWDARTGVLSWVDILAGSVHVCSASGEQLRSHHVGRPVGAALPSGRGGFLLADELGFTTLGVDGTAAQLLPLLGDAPDMRFNDAKCDPAGRALAGSMAADSTQAIGTLYRLDPGPVATPVLDGLTVSNGLGWSPDGRTMWFADSAKPQITGFEYDVETGEVGPKCSIIEVRDTPGVPDGLCVDDDGCIWLALWDGGKVRRYTPGGRVDTVVHVPVAQVTSCAFGGPGLSTLFITSSRWNLDAVALRSEPAAGGIFAVETHTTGPAATPWRDLTDPATRGNGNARGT
jgi:sugar lactone lactonase YvrE